MKPYFRIVGDCHGKIPRLIKLAKAAQYTVCLGDIGFCYKKLDEVSPERLRCLGGNHDDYTNVDGVFVNQPKHFLGDFGVWWVPQFGDVFYVRGARSIDQAKRTIGKDWWPDEELSYGRLVEAIDTYKAKRPDFVISHDCPLSVRVEKEDENGIKHWPARYKSATAEALEQMLQFHRPKHWLFGHHHVDWKQCQNGTQFRCLAELSYADFPSK